MTRLFTRLEPCILGCWLASLSCTASAASEFLRKRQGPWTPPPGPLRGARVWGRVATSPTLTLPPLTLTPGPSTPPPGTLAPPLMTPPPGVPSGCNCQGRTTGTSCSGTAAAMPYRPTMMPIPAQWPIDPPPPPPPLQGPPPPLPLVPAKPLPGIPSMRFVGVDLLPTLGPPPLWKMTPPPTLPPPFTTLPPTTPGPTTPAWVKTPLGLVAGTTLSPWLALTTRSPFAWRPIAPAPAAAPVPIAFLQARADSWSPLSFLRRATSWRSQREATVQPCRCPCEDLSSPNGVDRAFEGVMSRNLDTTGTLMP